MTDLLTPSDRSGTPSVTAEERRTFRAATLDEAVEAARAVLGPELELVEAHRVRRGGLGGFFATDLGVEIVAIPRVRPTPSPSLLDDVGTPPMEAAAPVSPTPNSPDVTLRAPAPAPASASSEHTSALDVLSRGRPASPHARDELSMELPDEVAGRPDRQHPLDPTDRSLGTRTDVIEDDLRVDADDVTALLERVLGERAAASNDAATLPLDPPTGDVQHAFDRLIERAEQIDRTQSAGAPDSTASGADDLSGARSEQAMNDTPDLLGIAPALGGDLDSFEAHLRAELAAADDGQTRATFEPAIDLGGVARPTPAPVAPLSGTTGVPRLFDDLADGDPWVADPAVGSDPDEDEPDEGHLPAAAEIVSDPVPAALAPPSPLLNPSMLQADRDVIDAEVLDVTDDLEALDALLRGVGVDVDDWAADRDPVAMPAPGEGAVEGAVEPVRSRSEEMARAAADQLLESVVSLRAQTSGSISRVAIRITDPAGLQVEVSTELLTDDASGPNATAAPSALPLGGQPELTLVSEGHG
ncbi:MAG: hypothetical protein AAGG08_00270 [Actinomycetota bacterium]